MRNCFLLLSIIQVTVASAQDTVTRSQIEGSEKMFGLSFSETKRDSMVSVLTDRLKLYNYLHAQNLNNDAPFPLWFNPLLPGMAVPRKQMPVHFIIPDNVALP